MKPINFNSDPPTLNLAPIETFADQSSHHLYVCIQNKLRHDTLVGSSGVLGSKGTENPGPVSADICASGLAFPLHYSQWLLNKNQF